MAVTCGFFNALEHDRLYDAIQMSSIFDGIIRDGIFSTIGTSMAVTASGNGLIVNVGAGRAWFNHTWILNDTAYPVEAEAAEVVLDRIDAVVIEVNSSAEVRDCSIKFVKGTPSSRPERPTMIHNAEVNQYALAYVSVRAGQTTIFQADITSVIGNDETPYITGLLQQTSIESIVAQWQDEFYTYFNNFRTTTTTDFNNWMSARVAEYNAWYASMEAEGQADLAEFDSWFQEMKDQLSEDAAGHLQAEIDALELSAEKGSVVTVTTSNDTLINRACTITQGSSVRTATFDVNKVAKFESVPFVGNMHISATNGVLIASKDITIPYFGRYEHNIEFWEATLDISSSTSELYGRSITISRGGAIVGTTSFDNTGHATFKVHEPGTYTVTSTTTGGDSFTTDVVVTEETSYPVDLGMPIGDTATPTDSIQIWLACGGKYGYNYTTIAQVMNDTELFSDLCADSNACDYMARSTTWASNVAGNAKAMQIVGLYDYCANKLLSNSTWCEAIVNSTYWASVLDPLVPTMTSNTTPSGECLVWDRYGTDYDPWKAFDNDQSTRAIAYNTSNAAAIGYSFNKKVKVVKVHIKAVTGNPGWRPGVTYLQGSNDGNTWVDLGNINITDYIFDRSFTVFNENSYSKYRVQSRPGNDSHVLDICELQFYGRAEANPTLQTIHSAANDTIYYLDGQTPVTVAVTDSNGVGEIDLESLGDGAHTLYSTVAKNPTNLSNPYSKTINVTRYTTEVYLMPLLGIIYWYGYKGNIDFNAYAYKTNGYAGVLTATYNTNNFEIKIQNTGGYTYGCALKTLTNQLDLSNVNSIKLLGKVSQAKEMQMKYGITNTPSSYCPDYIEGKNYNPTIKNFGYNDNTDAIYSADISGVNSGYLEVWGFNVGTVATQIKAIWLE